MPNVILPIYYNVLLKLLYIYSLQHQPLFVYVNKQNNQQLPCCLPFSILISALMTLNLIQSTERSTLNQHLPNATQQYCL